MLALKLRMPWSDGSVELLVSPLDLLARLAALVARPGKNGISTRCAAAWRPRRALRMAAGGGPAASPEGLLGHADEGGRGRSQAQSLEPLRRNDAARPKERRWRSCRPNPGPVSLERPQTRGMGAMDAKRAFQTCNGGQEGMRTSPGRTPPAMSPGLCCEAPPSPWSRRRNAAFAATLRTSCQCTPSPGGGPRKYINYRAARRWCMAPVDANQALGKDAPLMDRSRRSIHGRT